MEGGAPRQRETESARNARERARAKGERARGRGGTHAVEIDVEPLVFDRIRRCWTGYGRLRAVRRRRGSGAARLLARRAERRRHSTHVAHAPDAAAEGRRSVARRRSRAVAAALPRRALRARAASPRRSGSRRAMRGGVVRRTRRAVRRPCEGSARWRVRRPAKGSGALAQRFARALAAERRTQAAAHALAESVAAVPALNLPRRRGALRVPRARRNFVRRRTARRRQICEGERVKL